MYSKIKQGLIKAFFYSRTQCRKYGMALLAAMVLCAVLYDGLAPIQVAGQTQGGALPAGQQAQAAIQSTAQSLPDTLGTPMLQSMQLTVQDKTRLGWEYNPLALPDIAQLSQNNAVFNPSVGPTNLQQLVVATGSVQSLKNLKQINSDGVAWLTINGTNINYGVVQGYDNFEYVNLDIYRNNSKNGCIWAESRCSFAGGLSRNTVLFGHNWTNWTATPYAGRASDVMFAQLTAYQYRDYALNHPYIQLTVGENIYTFVLFAAFNTDIQFDYIDPNPDDQKFMGIVNDAIARSDYVFSTDVNATDKILTLSTCSQRFGSSRDQRFVVMARLLRNGEELPVVTAKENLSPKRPNL